MAIRIEPSLAPTKGRARVRLVARAIALTDGFVLIWAVIGAHVARFGVGPLFGDLDDTTSSFTVQYTWISVIVVVLWLASLRIHAAYDPRMLGHGTQEYRAVGTASFRLFAALAVVSYLSKLELARGYVLIAFPVGFVGLLVSRRVWRTWLGRHRARGNYADTVLVVGDQGHVASLIRDLRAAPDAGFGVVAACCSDPISAIEGVPVVGAEDDAAEAASRLGVDIVACSSAWQSGAAGLRRLGWALEGTGIDLVVSPALTDVAGPRIRARPVAGLPLLYVESPTFSGGRRFAKAAFDLVAASVMLLLALPIFVVTGALIWFEDRGPVLFSQRRVGLGGRTFVMYKFRSMIVGAEENRPNQNEGAGPLFKLRDDPRITRIGRAIRRWSIDELPQLANVLKGDMSLVGPRPPLESEVAAYEADVHRRLLVKPGLTGLWQVSGRSDLSWEDSVRLDLYYVENWSFTSDLRIVWRTVRALWERRGAY